MTTEEPDGSRPRDLREQAAEWFAQRREPQTTQEQSKFAAWLAADPLHREAYSRISETFSLGKTLRNAADQPSATAQVPQRTVHRALLVGTYILLSVASAFPFGASLLRHEPLATQVVTHDGNRHADDPWTLLATKTGEIRRFRLSDGSSVTLDTSSRVAVALAGRRRTLRLLSGRARFNVAHEARPFVVAAHGGNIMAHGTLFDVHLKADQSVAVRLLRGAVEVTLDGTQRIRARLAPGQQLSFLGETMTAPLPAERVDERWPSALLDCEGEPLSEVAAAANRYSHRHIVFTDPKIAALKVSGRFRIDHAEPLVDRLASLFDLRVDRTDPAQLILQSRYGITQSRGTNKAVSIARAGLFIPSTA